MASDHDNFPLPDGRDDIPGQWPPGDMSRPADRDWQQSGSGRTTPDSFHKLRQTNSDPRGQLPPQPGWDAEPRRSSDRNRPRQRNGRSASGGQSTRICKKCGEPLTGQFVRALDGTFHLDCFKCQDCGQIVASKFFPADDENGEGQYPLCETDYFRRLGLLCFQCGGALRGSYITALDRKYHVDHFTCSLCPTVFGAQDSYYEHDGNVYCHYHYSTQFAQRCNGCQTSILKQFVEIFRNGQNQHWHPECYMIHKFWNVRLTQPVEGSEVPETIDDPETRERIRFEEEQMEEKVFRIWSVLSTFEESSAACISDMLLHVSNGAYVDGVLVAKRFIWHVEILFQSTDTLDATMSRMNGKGMSYGREAKLLCKKIVSFFSLLSKAQDTGARKLGVTQELLSLVTGLAHYLKLLIRICLQGALRLEREASASEGLYQFLDDLNDFESFRGGDDGALSMTPGGTKLSAKDSDHCTACRRSVEDACAKVNDMRWHLACVNCATCSRELGSCLEDACFNPFDRKVYCIRCMGVKADGFPPFERITKLGQYAFLLRVALARLLDILRGNGALPPADASGNGLLATDRPARGDPPRLDSDSRSKSYAHGNETEHRRESSYESTLADVKRLRSTRLDRHLSTSVKNTRSSRILDSEGRSQYDTSADAGGDASAALQNDAITLDDIPRIVAVEQSRELQQQQARDRGAPNLHRSPATDSHLHQTSQSRSHSPGREQDIRNAEGMNPRIGRRFFSELSGLEYFNVRHLAVLTMHPMVENEFSLEELLSFVESRKQANFWKNIGKAFKNDKSKNVKKKGVFGVPLEMIVERDAADSTDGVGPGTLRIPAVVEDLISSMRKMDMSVEGIFRKNGNIKKQQECVTKIDTEGCESVDFMSMPAVQLAAMLKRYLRDLPDPLMTTRLYKLWVSAAKISDPDKRKQCLHLTCCLLPKGHRDCLEILFSFLKWTGSFHQLDEENGSKMDVRNLATVIAPNVLSSPSKALAMDSEAIYVIDAVETMINNIEEMCQVPDDILTLLNDPYLFNSTEITPKEILRRFQDRKGQMTIADHEVYSKQESSTRPPARRVDTDPAVWKGETTVRPVQDVPMPPYMAARQGAGAGQSGPSPRNFQGRENGRHAPHSPYGPGAACNNSESQLVDDQQQQRREWRNSGVGRQGNGLGVGNS